MDKRHRARRVWIAALRHVVKQLREGRKRFVAYSARDVEDMLEEEIDERRGTIEESSDVRT